MSCYQPLVWGLLLAGGGPLIRVTVFPAFPYVGSLSLSLLSLSSRVWRLDGFWLSFHASLRHTGLPGWTQGIGLLWLHGCIRRRVKFIDVISFRGVLHEARTDACEFACNLLGCACASFVCT
jgi:hypothetical protein